MKDTIRIAAVQFELRTIKSTDDFRERFEYYVRIASEYGADFVVFPELFTMQLLAPEQVPPRGANAVKKSTGHTHWLIDLTKDLAKRFNINLIAGSHLTLDKKGNPKNISYIGLRDGSFHTQEKIHPTPSERSAWKLQGGDVVDAIETDCGPIGVLICYDSEFPELTRRLADQGAMILFVPYCTDDRRGHLRVKYCAHARAVENQIYVVAAGVVGNVDNIDNMDVHYAESCIITPCDLPFARDGIEAEAPANTEAVAFADIRLSDLHAARKSGAVRNFTDRRTDLYSVTWHPDKKRD